jgi:hypothetical protein
VQPPDRANTIWGHFIAEKQSALAFVGGLLFPSSFTHQGAIMAKLPFILGLSCLALLPATAFAEDQPTGPAEPAAAAEATFETLSVEQLATILTEAGAEDVTPSATEKVVQFKSGGRNFFVSLSGCDEATAVCSVVAIGRAIKAKLPLEVLNKLNERYSGLISATRLNETSFKMVHASVVSGGVTKSNVAVNIVWYVNESPQFESFIKSQLVAEAFGKRPDIQNLSEGLPLGDVVLSPDEVNTLVDALHVPSPATRMKVK